MKGRYIYVPGDFARLVDEYRQNGRKTSDALRSIVNDAQLGREFSFIAKEKIPSFMRSRDVKKRFGFL